MTSKTRVLCTFFFLKAKLPLVILIVFVQLGQCLFVFV